MKTRKRRPPPPPPAQPAPAGRAVPKPLVTIICVALAVSVLLVYAQTFHFGFVAYDDDRYIYDNPPLNLGLSGAGIAWAMTTFASANWHPLTWVSYLLDEQLFGINAGAFHVVNVLLHIVAAILLFLALLRMTRAPYRCALVAGVFALHPLHVESVAWISERKDVLSTLCEMAALLLYARYVERRSVGRYLAVMAAFALGLMAKPMLVTFPLVLLLLDYWPLERVGWPPSWASAKGPVLEKLPLLALSFAGSLLTVAAQRSFGAVAGLQPFPLSGRVANAAVAYLEYIWQTLWPLDLGVLYPAVAPPASETFLAAAVLVAITIAAVRLARQRPYFLTGWLWYLGMLVPVIGLVQVGSQSRADRYMYVPLVGLSIVVIWMAADWAAKRPDKQRVLGTIGVIYLLLCAGCAYRQASYWRDSQTLFEHTLAVTGPNAIMSDSLGLVLAGQGKYDAAAGQYREALALSSDYVEAHYNLGNALTMQGKLQEAVTQYEAALQIRPAFADAHNNLGMALAAAGQFQAAIDQYRQTLALDPGRAVAHANLGHELLRAGQLDAAVDELNKALQLKADLPVAEADLGILLASRGNYEEASRHLLQAAREAPGSATNESNLCFALLRAHRLDEAVTHCKEALRIEPNLIDAHFNLGSALAAQGRKAEARVEFDLVLRLDPANAGARKALAEM